MMLKDYPVFYSYILFMLGVAAGLHMPSAMATITAMVNRQEWGKALAVHQTAPPLRTAIRFGAFVAPTRHPQWNVA